MILAAAVHSKNPPRKTLNVWSEFQSLQNEGDMRGEEKYQAIRKGVWIS